VTTTPPVIDSPVPVLTHVQRVQLRELLDERWRQRVVELTDLAVEFHALDDESADRDVVAYQLAGVRRQLVDVESAMQRFQSRTYGSCDGCDRRLPFEQLELRPEMRYCRTCQPVVRRRADAPAGTARSG
jgi:RNA polymerase-binding transcription factor DksA